jgi:hypothetical protein
MTLRTGRTAAPLPRPRRVVLYPFAQSFPKAALRQLHQQDWERHGAVRGYRLSKVNRLILLDIYARKVRLLYLHFVSWSILTNGAPASCRRFAI